MHGQIHASMYTGSMVGAGAMAFALMPYAIANARVDEGSTVDLNPVVLAAIFGEPEEKVTKTIEYLCSPDPRSRRQEHDGRRLIPVGPGPFRYKVVNLEFYRQNGQSEDRTEYWRQYRQWERRGRKGTFTFKPVHVNTVNGVEHHCDVQSTYAYADTNTHANTGTDTSPTPSKVPKNGYLPLPDAFNTEAARKAWEIWQDHRREIKHPLTPTSAKAQMNLRLKWGEQKWISVIEHSVANGWQGLFEPTSKTVQSDNVRQSPSQGLQCKRATLP